MRLYVSYADQDDQLTALRVQALVVASGHSVYVPPASTRHTGRAATEDSIEYADAMLGVIGGARNEACQTELDYGQRMGKAIIVLEGPESAVGIRGLMEQIDRAQIEPDGRQALLGAAIVALGLMRLRAGRGGSGRRWW